MYVINLMTDPALDCAKVTNISSFVNIGLYQKKN